MSSLVDTLSATDPTGSPRSSVTVSGAVSGEEETPAQTVGGSHTGVLVGLVNMSQVECRSLDLSLVRLVVVHDEMIDCTTWWGGELPRACHVVQNPSRTSLFTEQ